MKKYRIYNIDIKKILPSFKMLFLSIQQKLDCINDQGEIVGKIQFDTKGNKHIFCPSDSSKPLSTHEKETIFDRLKGLDTGIYNIPMQDDD